MLPLVDLATIPFIMAIMVPTLSRLIQVLRRPDLGEQVSDADSGAALAEALGRLWPAAA